MSHKREIKFRAWSKEVGMRYKMPVQEDTDCLNLSNELGKDGWIIMQFTGLLDKKGKEVYEGDVIDWDGSKIMVEYGIQSVDAFEGVGFNLWSFYGKYEDIGKAVRLQSEIEIIGNIYENPELLIGLTKR